MNVMRTVQYCRVNQSTAYTNRLRDSCNTSGTGWSCSLVRDLGLEIGDVTTTFNVDNVGCSDTAVSEAKPVDNVRCLLLGSRRIFTKLKSYPSHKGR